MLSNSPPILSEDDAEKASRLTMAVLSGLYSDARDHYIRLLLGIWAYGATRDQLMSDIRPVEDAAFSETALDTLLNDGTFVLAVFEAPHPYEEGKMVTHHLIFHREYAKKIEVLQNPERYRQQWAAFQAEQRLPYVAAEIPPTLSSPNYPWNRSEYAEEQSC